MLRSGSVAPLQVSQLEVRGTQQRFLSAGSADRIFLGRSPDARRTLLDSAVMERGIVALELLGILVLVGAWLCSLATTLMSTWLTMCPDLLPTVTFELGLWEACVIHEGGTQGCQPHSSLLALPPDIQLARILMCLSLAAGMLALLVTVPGMTGVKSCDDQVRWKRGLRMAGGVLGLAAGVLGLAPVSYVAHLTVERFFDESVPEVMPRWEFGDAMFCGWTAGVLHLLSGTLLLASGWCTGADNWSAPVNISMGYPKTRTGTRTSTRSEYV